MDIETKIAAVKKRPTEEIVTEEDLRSLLESKKQPVAYNGFEPSGLAHLGTGLLTALKVNDLTSAGIKYILFLADWHAELNEKFGGDREKIRMCAMYMKEVWMSLIKNPDMVEIKMGSEVYDDEYWKLVVRVAKEATIRRVMRAATAAGRYGLEEHLFYTVAKSMFDGKHCPLCGAEVDKLGRTLDKKLRELESSHGFIPSTSLLIYTPMQVADIFRLGVDICQLGMDQRKANMLAREIGPRLGFWKPVAVHHHILMSLFEPKRMESSEATMIESKMSKSKPSGAIFVHDTPEEIEAKMKSAWCPPSANENPVIEYVKHLILRDEASVFTVETAKGDEISYSSIEQLEKDYTEKKLHPLDLKISVARALAKMLEPVRKRFQTGEARKLYESVREFVFPKEKAIS
ncbi:MAG: tyrosine--tRNA ligase [Candidatus Korarchaeota archaeon]